MSNYICIRTCYHNNQVWQVGDTMVAEKDNCPHFKLETPEVEQEVKDLLAPDEVVVAPDNSNGSQTRDRAVKQCGKHGIAVKSSMTVAEMRTALKEKGVVVS